MGHVLVSQVGSSPVDIALDELESAFLLLQCFYLIKDLNFFVELFLADNFDNIRLVLVHFFDKSLR